jgi:hypothetical protein
LLRRTIRRRIARSVWRGPEETPVDAELAKAINAIKADKVLLEDAMSDKGVPWGRMMGTICTELPEDLPDAKGRASNLIPRALNEIYGIARWKSEKRPRKSGGETTYIFIDRPRAKKKRS